MTEVKPSGLPDDPTGRVTNDAGAFPTRRTMRATEARSTARMPRIRRSASAPVATPAFVAPKASATTAKRKPLNVLVTMAFVGGLFAVAGLPAYSVTASEVFDDRPSLVITDAQSLKVADSAQAALTVRDGYNATSEQQLAAASMDSVRAANNAAYLASGAREAGDDYPWAYELSSSQGGGLSPLNYYYRECVDFVAWRLNRDAGSYEAPYKYVWSNLTPAGGNASQWKGNWETAGWTVSSTPVAGSVAWWGRNHVAYVKEVLDGGMVLLEEYNYNWSASYSQRTIPASDVDAFLYPPGQ